MEVLDLDNRQHQTQDMDRPSRSESRDDEDKYVESMFQLLRAYPEAVLCVKEESESEG